MSRLARLLGAVLAGALLLGGAAPASAADETTVLRLRADRLAAAGRCEEAIPLLERVMAEDPRDGRAALRLGQCHIRLGRHAEAIEALEEARQRDPGLPGVDLQLAIARFHLGDLDGAEAALAAAERTQPDDPELLLYRGLVRLSRARTLEAAADLERAALADPEGVEPLASYYAGLAWAQGNERERARAALERVIERAPDSPWAEPARAALERLRTTGPPPWWVTLTVGGEYDDNVVLRARGVTLPAEISGTHDVRAVWALNAGAELARSGPWAVGAMLSYRGSVHQELEQFNDHYPVGTLWLDRSVGERTLARVQYDVGYAWFQGDPFLLSHTLTPALHHVWREAGETRLFARGYRYNYLFGTDEVLDGVGAPGDPCPVGVVLCGPPGLDESRARNRDGTGFAVGVEHAWPVPGLADTELLGGYTYHRYAARGRDYDHQGHEGMAGVRTRLPADLGLELTAHWEYRPFRHPSSFPDPADLVAGQQYPLASRRRRDQISRYEARLSRALTDTLSVSARYAYYDNDSNVAVFDYDREVVGAYLTWRLQP